ncbi:nucleoside deaminase [Cytophagaceae bacterium DM2B3-1]|uniref:Nucleoside deaminase n=1 Tax=Xanthocytophaga flava TaxID=3048013 RepID=A0ABT7CQL9_9BACT|nr:nucleoside deaminase [Xanthocytophaga flavus]MDJ1496051.1 nucleoside deaminase [Xanthocytophaga flavus]
MSIPNPDFMREAIQLSLNTMRNGNGGPFGAVIVKDGQIIARGYNRVLETNDPTAHAEVVAIREATQSLGTFDLEGCEIYTSCEPCPMCLGAIYWSHISRMYYANTKADAEAIGFDDHFIYDELDRDPAHRRLQSLPLLRDEAIRAFEEWASKTDKQSY